MAPTDLMTLSASLGFAPQHVFYLVELADQMYFEFKIPKANGKLRKISAPRTDLKGVQRAILEKILHTHSVHSESYAYVRGKSVIQAAEKLSGHKAVLRLDITDFFPTITDKRVFGFFRSIGYNETTAYILTKLCTFKGALCQGAPTSPCLSNLIFQRADRQLTSLAKTFQLAYLRYSDDIFIYADRNFRHQRVASIARKIIEENGFSLNNSKTQYHRRNSPRFTLGLQTMSKRPQLSRRVKRENRAAFHKASISLNWGSDNLNRLTGIAEWHKAIYGRDDLYRDYIRIIRNVRSLKLHEAYLQ